ncbi:MAG TPA: ferredoxin reductase [Gemmatimonadaceae bacterium]|nr:ferredoxin reductase [Gemmatimonadaceae bacterium]
MTSAGAAPKIAWRLATVLGVVHETPSACTLTLDVPGWPGHRAGQHVDVRLTAEDGYQTERSYSIASPPADARLALTIERLDDGEVSPYLSDELRPGDKLELRGPIGGYFVWDVATGGPLLLVGGGSGIVPLMAMLRHRDTALGTDVAARRQLPVRLLYSSRRWEDVIYRDELARMAARDPTLAVTHTLTREQPAGWTGFKRRIDRAMLETVAWPASAHPQAFVCGPTALVEAVSADLVELGHEPALIKTERFGPTGGAV